MMRTVNRVTITVTPDDSVWGFSELLAEMPKKSSLQNELDAIMDLIREDLGSFIEDNAEWSIEIRDQNG